MAAPASTGASPAAAVVGALVAEIETELDPLVGAIGERIRKEIPDFRRLPHDTLAGAIRGNVTRALTALRDVRPPTAAELERERGADVASVLAFSETLWLWADAVMDIVGTAHREVEPEQAREEQQRRDAFVLALLSGTLDAAELRLQSATFGLDADRSYIPFRARSAGDAPLSRRVAVALAGDDGLVTGLDRDFAGIAARRPAPAPRVVCGLGPPARLEALPPPLAPARRAPQ